MLLINNHNNNINRIDRKLSKSIMLFKIKINIIKDSNKGDNRYTILKKARINIKNKDVIINK